MVLNSHHSLTASTTLASVVSAVILTAVGLCIPYTERAVKSRAARPSSVSERPAAAPAQPTLGPGRASPDSSPRQRAADTAPH